MEGTELVAFISHATGDNERFVVPFNTALRRPGLRTIMDVQDFKPGESLVSHIFDDGIYRASAIVIVISRETGERPWVRAELEHAVVRNVEEQVPMLVIVLDDAAVPPPLRTTVQIRVSTSQTPEQVAELAAEALLGRLTRQSIGNAPRLEWVLAPLRGLRADQGIDDYVARYAIEQLLGSNLEYVDVTSLLAEIEGSGEGGADELETSLHILEHEGHIVRMHEMGTSLPFAFKLTTRGIDLFLKRFAGNLYHRTYGEVVGHVRAAFPASVDISALASDLAAPSLLILHDANIMASKGLARVEQYVGGEGDITGLPSIRRIAQQ